jgi:hypothetical protein
VLGRIWRLNTRGHREAHILLRVSLEGFYTGLWPDTSLPRAYQMLVLTLVAAVVHAMVHSLSLLRSYGNLALRQPSI